MEIFYTEFKNYIFKLEVDLSKIISPFLSPFEDSTHSENCPRFENDDYNCKCDYYSELNENIRDCGYHYDNIDGWYDIQNELKLFDEKYLRYISKNFYLISIEDVYKKNFIESVFILDTCFEINKTYNVDEMKLMYNYQTPVIKLFYTLYKNKESLINYINMIKDGVCKIYHKNGLVKEEFYKNNGMFDGIYKTYYITSKLKTETEYKNNMKNGFCISYYENGIIHKKYTYILNQKQEYIENNESGNVIYSCKFINGLCEDYENRKKNKKRSNCLMQLSCY